MVFVGNKRISTGSPACCYQSGAAKPTGLVGMKGAEAAEAEDRRASKEKEANSHLWVCAALDAVGRAWPACAPPPAATTTAAATATADVSESSTGRDSPLLKRRCADVESDADADSGSPAAILQRRSAVAVLSSLLAALQSSAFEIKAAIANAIERYGCETAERLRRRMARRCEAVACSADSNRIILRLHSSVVPLLAAAGVVQQLVSVSCDQVCVLSVSSWRRGLLKRLRIGCVGCYHPWGRRQALRRDLVWSESRRLI